MQNDRSRLFILIVTGILFGVYFFVFGQSGLLERMQLQNRKNVLYEKNRQLEEQNIELYRKYRAYQRGEYDMFEAERNGYIQPGAKVLRFDIEDQEVKSPVNPVLAQLYSKNSNNLKILRILWLIISTVIIILLILPKLKSND